MSAAHPDPDDALAGWLDGLTAERYRHRLPPGIRDQAEHLADRTLGLLFPAFDTAPADRLTEQLDELRALLCAVLRALLPNNEPTERCAAYLSQLPAIHRALQLDARAIHDGDPAAESTDEVILAYPGFLAIALHRLAHPFYTLNVPLLPRLIGELAHRRTGIDIHPGATIGPSFSIDHGTGIVIGETTVIGARVRLFQGVTLGALCVAKGLARTKRHPTVEDDVVIYANATILGGETVVGRGSVVGGNVWLTRSVEPETVVTRTSRTERRPVDEPVDFTL